MRMDRSSIGEWGQHRVVWVGVAESVVRVSELVFHRFLIEIYLNQRPQIWPTCYMQNQSQINVHLFFAFKFTHSPQQIYVFQFSACGGRIPGGEHKSIFLLQLVGWWCFTLQERAHNSFQDLKVECEAQFRAASFCFHVYVRIALKWLESGTLCWISRSSESTRRDELVP